MKTVIFFNFLIFLVADLFNVGNSSPLSFKKREITFQYFESLPGVVKSHITTFISPIERSKLAVASKDIRKIMIDNKISPNVTQLSLLYNNCPKWIVRNATENPWIIFTENPLYMQLINLECLKALQQSVESISRIQTLDLRCIEFDHESISILDDLLKRKTFTFISIGTYRNRIRENHLLKIFSNAKGIEMLEISVLDNDIPSSEDIQSFAKSSKIKHLKIDLILVANILPYSYLFENLESITIKYDKSYPNININLLNRFPKLNSLYSADHFKQVMKAKDSITGASLDLDSSTQFTLPLKKLKSLHLRLYGTNNEDNFMYKLMESKETLETLQLDINYYYKITKELVLSNPFFKHNTLLKHLSVSLNYFNRPVNFSGLELNLLSFSLRFVKGYEINSNVLEFIKTQTHLRVFSYKLSKFSESFHEFYIFYEQICLIMKGNKNIKTLVLSLPMKVTFEFVYKFVELTKSIGRVDFTLNSIRAEYILNLDPYNIPFYLFKLTSKKGI